MRLADLTMSSRPPLEAAAAAHWRVQKSSSRNPRSNRCLARQTATKQAPSPACKGGYVFASAFAPAKGARRLRRFRVAQSQGPCEITERRDSADGEAA